MDITKFFEINKKENCVYFKGDTLEILIPRRYENYGNLYVGEYVTTLGIFNMLINGKIKSYFNLPTMIVIESSVVENVTVDNVAYVKAYLNKNDKFMRHTEVIKDNKIAYMLFKEFISLGKVPAFMKYVDAPKIFDNARKYMGVKFSSNQVLFEIIFSHLYRDDSDIMKPYRLTPMKKDPTFVPLFEIEHAATSTVGRIVGSYMNAGIVSSIVNPSKNNSRVEDILRT